MPTESADYIFMGLIAIGLICVALAARAFARWGNRRNPMKF